VKRARRHIVVWQFDQDRFGPTSRLSMVLATKRTPVALRIGPHKPHPEVRPGTSSQCLGRFLGPGEPIRKLTASSRECEISYDIVDLLLGAATALSLAPTLVFAECETAKPPRSLPGDGACGARGLGHPARPHERVALGLERAAAWVSTRGGKNDSLGVRD
jgi:hypothetical protein